MTTKCESCAAIADCKLAFGIFWREKSSQGVGCDTPFKGWPKNWRQTSRNQETPAVAKPVVRRGREKLVWQGEF